MFVSTERYGAVRLPPRQSRRPASRSTIRRRGRAAGKTDDAVSTSTASNEDPGIINDASCQGGGGNDHHRTTTGRTSHAGDGRRTTVSSSCSFRHDVPVAILALPPLLCSPLLVGDTTLLVTCISALTAYLFDLLNVRDGCLASIWLGFVATSCTALVSSLVDGWEGEGADWDLHQVPLPGGWGTLLRAVAFVLLIFCVASWATLQLRWLPDDLGCDAARLLERTLLRTLPPISTSIVTYVGVAVTAHFFGTDFSSRGAPYFAATWLRFAMRAVSRLTVSFPPDDGGGGGKVATAEFVDTRGGGTSTGEEDDDDVGGNEKDGCVWEQESSSEEVDETGMTAMVLSGANGKLLSCLLLFLPPLLQVAAVGGPSSSWDDACDLTLVVSVPWLLHGNLVRSGAVWWWWGDGTRRLKRETSRLPAAISWLIGSGSRGGGGDVTTVAAVLATTAFQWRYVAGPCAAMASSFRGFGVDGAGDDVREESLRATTTLLAGASASLWGAWRLSTSTSTSPPPLMWLRLWPWRGTATEADYGSMTSSSRGDVLSLVLVATSSLLLSSACGVPRMAMASIAAMASSLSLFVRTGSPRYVAFSFAVACALLCAGVHRGMGSDRHDVCLTAVVVAPMLSLAIGVMTAVPRGDREGDGSTLATTTVAAMAATSDVRVANARREFDLAGFSLVSYASVVCVAENFLLRDVTSLPSSSTPTLSDLYCRVILVFLTSAILLAITARLWWYTGSIGRGCATSTASVALGKLAVLLDHGGGGGGGGGGGMDLLATDISPRVAASSILAFIILAPYAFFEPIAPVASAAAATTRRRGSSRVRRGTVLPREAPRFVATYQLILLPLVILMSLATLMIPLGGVAASPVIRIVAGSLCLWGICTVSTTVYLFPNGGAHRLMRIAVAMALLGMVITASSFGSGGLTQNVTVQTYIGVIGLLISFLSCYVAAIVGQTCSQTKRKSSLPIKDPALKRLVICGALFSSGLASFFGTQNMEGASMASTFLTVTFSVFISICGSTAIVLGHYLNLVYVDGAILRIAKVCTLAFVLSFVVLISTSSWMDDASRSGDWFSTYLIVCFALLASFSVGLRYRSEKSLNTRKLGNTSCVLAWGISLLLVYFRHGISGFDSEGLRMRLFGIPVSVVWTFAVSPILLLLEGPTPVRNTQSVRISSQASIAMITGQKLTRANRLAPLVGGTAAVFVMVTLYSICFRGCAISLGIILHDSRANMEHVVLGNVSTEAVQMQLGTQSHEEIALIAMRNSVDGGAIHVAERFDGSCFCTAGSVFGPLLHLAGTLAILPSLVLLVIHIWSGSRQSPTIVVALLPLNLFCLVLCKGIPSLRAAAIIGFFGGIYHLESMRRNKWKHLMKI